MSNCKKGIINPKTAKNNKNLSFLKIYKVVIIIPITKNNSNIYKYGFIFKNCKINTIKHNIDSIKNDLSFLTIYNIDEMINKTPYIRTFKILFTFIIL